MCGIVGVVRSDPSPEDAAVGRMVAALRHRGPDATGVVNVDDNAVLGHARLSIIDLSARARQPMTDGSGRYTITYNGEVYNFAELRSELKARGHSFRTHSDTEVVIEAYAKWGPESFARLNGMFALGIWDAQEKELVLARDRFGEKPLFYTTLPSGFAFASEVSALKLAPGFVDRSPSLAGLNHFLALGYILGPGSIHRDVLKLEPASYLRYRLGGAPRVIRYWSYADAFRRRRRGALRDLAYEIEHQLGLAVSRRLVADVPVGAFLSGGLDSSTICALARQHLPYPLHTFSAGFDSPTYDESAAALLVARHLGCTHHETLLRRDDGARLTEEALRAYDEPLSDTSLVPMVHVSRLARRHVKVVLSGDGADEIFGGYPTYRADLYRRSLAWLPGLVRRELAAWIADRVPRSRRKLDLAFRARQFARGLPNDPRRAHYTWREIHDRGARIELLGAQHRDEIEETDPFRTFERHYAEVADLDPLSQHLYVDAKTWLADDVLVKLDRATMSTSLEARAPFLDPLLVELVASLPGRLKVGWFRQKHGLRMAASRLLPSSVLHRPKAGFNAPLHEWFRMEGLDEHRLFNRKIASEHLGIRIPGSLPVR
jgi:asparagine synthase (glutamine-hydrolysing)